MKIFHNPRCAKSRQALAIIEGKGIDVEIVRYLENVPTVSELRGVILKLGITPFDLIRKTEAVYKNEFRGKELSDNQWIDVMVLNPKLIERPIVIEGEKAIIGRPPENVLSFF